MPGRALLGPLVLAATASLALAGCGAARTARDSRPVGERLTIYSSLPLAGAKPEPLIDAGAGQPYPKAEAEAARARSAQITEQNAEAALAGERLALEQAAGRGGRFRVNLVSLSDAGRAGEWSQGATAANATRAVRDKTTIAYIGDWDSAASAISLPLTNPAGILQVSPMSPYVGLTSSFYAGQDDPERFYPAGKRSFVRVMPGDVVEGAAEARLASQLGVRRIYVVNDGEPFDLSLAGIVAGDARRQGLQVVGESTVETGHASAETNFQAQIAPILESGAEAVFFSGQPSAGAAALWEQLHAAAGELTLLGSSQLAEQSFAKAIGAGAASSSYLATPVLPDTSYSAAARRVLAELKGPHGAPASPYALCGYEAMSLVLAAIRAAGSHGDDREAVVKAALQMRREGSVLGSYSVLGSGETTLSSYGVDRIEAGQLVFWRKLTPALGTAAGEHLP
ncbi:MAG: branched-chain amino acid ABC transporter substrate-binding protein [Solirubrobacteraceae bacterium]